MAFPTRRVLLGAGLAGGTAALVGCERENDASGTPTSPVTPARGGQPASPPAVSPGAPVAPSYDPTDWASVKEQFFLDPSRAQFSAFVLSGHTRPLQAAIDGYRDELNLDTEGTLLREYGKEKAAQKAAAAYAGGTPGQYALTDSTTMGIATMYGGLTLAPGEEILTTFHDFFSTEDALRLASLRSGAKVVRVRLYDDPAEASVDEMVSRLLAGVSARTRVVAVTWVHSSTGVRTPIREFADALAGRGVLLCVDGVHGFGAVDVDLPDLGCDVLATGTHKWLFGPRGTGIVWARSWDPLTEIIPTFSGPREGARLSPGGYHTFEHRWALKEAFELAGAIGRDRIVARTVEQATQLKEGLADLDGIRLVTPLDPDVSAGIVCLDVKGMQPTNAFLELSNRGIAASVTPYQVPYLRLGPSIATDPADVDLAISEIARLAKA